MQCLAAVHAPSFLIASLVASDLYRLVTLLFTSLQTESKIQAARFAFPSLQTGDEEIIGDHGRR